MEGEIGNFIGVWSTAIISGIYCYTVSKSTKANSPLRRLLLLLPAIAAFTALPLSLSSFHLGVVTFFSLTWLANFKLLLLSFHTGPLAAHPAVSSLSHFLCALLLPIKFTTADPARPGLARSIAWAKAAAFWGKVLCFGMLVVPYSYEEELPEALLLTLHCGHFYLVLEMSLAAAATLTRASLGLHRAQLAPQFNEPYLSTSVQDFWGRRWNLIASDILKQTVHTRIRSYCTPVIGKESAMYVGIFATFLVSGIMHVIMYYYITRVATKWAIIRFFISNGLCMIVEVKIKTTVFTERQLHRAISTLLTGAFIGITTVWLLFPILLTNKAHKKAIFEYLVVANYVKNLTLYI